MTNPLKNLWTAKPSRAAQWLLFVLCISTLIAFTGKRQSDGFIPNIVVEIEERAGLHFVNSEQVHALVQAALVADIEKVGDRKKLHLGHMERSLERNGFIERAAISQDLTGRLLVEIDQTLPIARVLATRGQDFYISDAGKVVPVSPLYTARVVTLEGPGARRLAQLLPASDSASMAIVAMLNYIAKDEFWSKQVAGLDIDDRGEIKILPQLGSQTIQFGSSQNFKTKFGYLLAFYHRILPAKGWGRYRTVSVKYENQIICE